MSKSAATTVTPFAPVGASTNSTPADLGGGRAPLKNMARFAALVERAQSRKEGRSRLACFSGWSGYGKSVSAAFAAQNYRCFYVEARSHWTKRTMMEAILRQVGGGSLNSARMSVSAMTIEVAKRLADSRRSLIIDEFDNAVDRNLVELTRDLYEQSKAVIILVGEEALPTKLEAWERFHSRIGGLWEQAHPCDVEDGAALARLYCPGLSIGRDLLADLVEQTHGSARRITENLDDVLEFATGEGLTAVSLAEWSGRGWMTGDSPAARNRR